MGTPRLDLVDAIDYVGRVIRRHPFLCLAVASEATLLLVGLGWVPELVGTVVGFPAYAVHMLSALVFGSSYFLAVGGLLGVAGCLDLLWRRLL